jgi:iron complex outermembrane receptor protein
MFFCHHKILMSKMSNQFSARAILFLLFSAVVNLLYAQNAGTGNIKGTITTKDGKPAPSVVVLIKDGKRSVIANENGSYSFSNLPEGNYTLVTSYTGLQSQSRKVTLKNGETATVNFSLEETHAELQEVIVTTQRGLNDKPATLGKVAIAPKDLPQAVQVIDKAILERQQVLRISDVLQNTNGVYISGAAGGYQEEISARGYAFTSSNTFKNGSRFNNGILTEFSSVEKVEFLKGGSAILFGNVAAGGVLNIVTKKPKFEKGGEVSFRTGSYGFYKPSLDVYGALGNSSKAAYRLNTSYEKANSYRDNVNSERFYVNPSFLFKLNSKTELLIEGDYLKDNRTADFGTGAVDYAVANIPRSRFLGVTWGYNKAEQATANATLTHQFNKQWQLKGVVSYQSYQQELFAAARPNASSQFIKTDGTWIRGLQKSATDERYYVAQVDLTGKFATGKIKHTFLIGADADKYNTKANTYNLTAFNNDLSNAAIKGKNIYDTINIYNPATFTKRNDIPYLAIDRITTSPIERIGVYVQDLITVTEKLKVLAGVRYSYQNNLQATVDTLAKNTKGFVVGYITSAFSPRVGVVYQPTKSISVFASYTNNFTPNTGTDINNLALKPSIINQYEVGIKNELFKGLLSANITAYQIVNSNFAQTVLPAPATNPAARELAGEVTSKGVEVDIMTKQIHGFSFIAGYSYNDTRYTKSNLYSKNDRLRYNPAHTGNASVYYNFAANTVLRGFNIGTGFYYVGSRVAGRNNTAANPTYKLMELPDYTTVDLSAGYSVKSYSLRLKFSNLFDVLSYNVHDDNSVNPIAPRQIAATVSYKF